MVYLLEEGRAQGFHDSRPCRHGEACAREQASVPPGVQGQMSESAYFWLSNVHLSARESLLAFLQAQAAYLLDLLLGPQYTHGKNFSFKLNFH